MSNQSPVFGAGTSFLVSENQTVVATLSATDDHDAVGSGLTYSIAGGPDGSQFTLDSATGALSFVTAPKFGAPTDAGANNTYDLTVRVTDSAGAHTDEALAVQVTNKPIMQIVITDGQSLTQGTTASPGVLSTVEPYPNQILGMNFGRGVPMNTGWQNRPVNTAAFVGLESYGDYVTETHTSGMLNEIISQYDAAGLIAPTFATFNVGAGSQSILQLMTDKQHTFLTTQAALASLADGQEFAIDKQDGSYDFYVDSGGTAQFIENLKGAIGEADNLKIELTLAVNWALANGYAVAPTVIFNWIQGETDNAVRYPSGTSYADLLGQVLDNVTAAAQATIGSNAAVLAAVSQIRNPSGTTVPIDQLSTITSRPNVIFGAEEAEFEAKYPSKATDPNSDFLHLSPTGYFMLGQTIGKKIFDALTGHEDKPIVMEKVVQVSATSIIVQFSGVQSYLVSDAFALAAANGVAAPANFGFLTTNGVATQFSGVGTTATTFSITNAQITGGDTVKLDFSAPISGAFQLSLGRGGTGSAAGFGGTTLRDASTTAALEPTNGTTLADPHIYQFAPDQYVTYTTLAAPAQLRVGADFSADLVSDVLLRSSQGGLTTELVTSQGALASGASVGALPTGSKVVATGDFNGDGLTDLLVADSTGALSTWTLGASGATVAALGNPGANLVVLASGNFNADWQSDILFQNAQSGSYALWDVSGGTVSGGGTIGTPGAAWVYKGAGDFNGDGKSDILFQNSAGTYAVWELNNSAIIGGGTIGSPGSGWFFKGVGDFNGDGKADILFENASGTYATWDLNGTAIIGGGTIGKPGADLTLVGIGDYNGDGMSDLLLRKADGTLTAWTLDDAAVTGHLVLGDPGQGLAVEAGHGANAFAALVIQDDGSSALTSVQVGSGAPVGSGALGTPGAGSSALGTGDFGATGETDVLVRDAGGNLALWASDGTTALGHGAIGNPGTDWSVAALGDFNGDGKTDILFQNTNSGAYATWDMSGTAITGGGVIGAAAGYALVAAADIDGDGKADLVFQNTATGAYAAWTLNDTAITGGGAIGNPGSDWTFKGTGDFNGDGKADLLFENTSGVYASWDLSGTAIIGGGVIGNPGAAWHLAKIADLNQDGKSDLVFEDSAGHVAAWILNDTAIIGGGTILTTLASNQHIV